jgi:hypothetical protein
MFKTILVSLLLLPIPSFAQQVNEYDVCTRHREVYVPGYYDAYGNYVSGRVNVESYKVSCGGEYAPRRTYNQYYPRRIYCDPTKTALGATLGGGIAASMSRGNGYRWSVPLGAFLGGVAVGCN